MSPDRAPLLPTHSDTTTLAASTSPSFQPPQHRLSQPRISFPSSTSTSKPRDGEAGDQHLEPWMVQRERDGARPGIPKLTRECFWSELKCYGKWVVLIGAINGILVGAGLWWYFSTLHKR